MKVWVIMGNDYPAAVFESQEAAEAFCALKKKENDKGTADGYRRMIYWRAYDFELQK